MPTRAITFKLIIPRDDAEEAVRARRAIWATHAFVNRATAYYETLLLEMRQRDVCVGVGEDGADRIVPGSDWQVRLCSRLTDRGLTSGQAEEALPLLRQLYALIVVSSQSG
ncbi:MAG: hypothetical protein P1P84_24560, partial [Deferrisomatales bacterium]|nr:hypothetical protein [Deferrisomatales bacterium]